MPHRRAPGNATRDQARGLSDHAERTHPLARARPGQGTRELPPSPAAPPWPPEKAGQGRSRRADPVQPVVGHPAAAPHVQQGQMTTALSHMATEDAWRPATWTRAGPQWSRGHRDCRQDARSGLLNCTGRPRPHESRPRPLSRGRPPTIPRRHGWPPEYEGIRRQPPGSEAQPTKKTGRTARTAGTRWPPLRVHAAQGSEPLPLTAYFFPLPLGLGLGLAFGFASLALHPHVLHIRPPPPKDDRRPPWSPTPLHDSTCPTQVQQPLVPEGHSGSRASAGGRPRGRTAPIAAPSRQTVFPERGSSREPGGSSAERRHEPLRPAWRGRRPDRV
jgi:hypothetical protein